MDFILKKKVLGSRSRDEWAHDFVDHKGIYPDDRELDDYIDNCIDAKLRFLSHDLKLATDEILAKADRIKRDAEENMRSAFDLVSAYRKEYEASLKELEQLKDSMEKKK